MADLPFKCVLPPGRFFTLAETAARTATAIYPAVKRSEPVVVYTRVTDWNGRDRAVSEAVTEELQAIWRESFLPEPTFPMDKCVWDGYVVALQRGRSSVCLVPVYSPNPSEEEKRRDATFEAHKRELDRAIERGLVAPLHPVTYVRLEPGAANLASLLTRSDVKVFAETVNVRIVDSDDSEPAPPESVRQLEDQPPVKAISRYQEQCSLILRGITAVGADPKKLPQHRNGRPGVRSEIWQWLEKHKYADRFGSQHNYRKIWQRMLADDSIKY